MTLTKKELNEILVDRAWGLLYKAHRWHKKAELRRWSIKELKGVIKELEER